MSAELQQSLRGDMGEMKSHLQVLIEANRSDVQFLAEHLAAVMDKLQRR